MDRCAKMARKRNRANCSLLGSWVLNFKCAGRCPFPVPAGTQLAARATYFHELLLQVRPLPEPRILTADAERTFKGARLREQTVRCGLACEVRSRRRE